MKRARETEEASGGSGSARGGSKTESKAEDASSSSSDDDFGPRRPTQAEEEAQSSSEDDFGPAPAAQPPARKRRRKLKFEKLYLSKLPSAQMYETSFMHRAPVTHICVSRTQFVVTASGDGFLKFWKKIPGGIEFVKQYKAHLAPITGLAVSDCGFYCCSASADKSLKMYDVINFDMINLINLKYVPTCCEWVHERKARRGAVVAVGRATGEINLYKVTSSGEALRTFRPHAAAVTAMRFNPRLGAVVSVCARGMIEYWSPETLKHPVGVKWKYKTDTDLFDLVKFKARATALSVSPDGRYFATMSTDCQVRVFRFATGKLIRKYAEELDTYNAAQKEEESLFKLDSIDYGRRVAVERELEKDSEAAATAVASGEATPKPLIPPSNVIFDASGNFIIYPTMLGIKIVNIRTNKLNVLMGKVENTERFLGIALFQGIPKEVGLSAVASLGSAQVMAAENALDSKKSQLQQEDPALFCCAYKKDRFYWFSRREPGEEGRDIFNEKPKNAIQSAAAETASSFGSVAVVHTTMGDLTFVLFPKECPKTIENFVTHSKNGYYNGTVFHRVIKNFMVQGGDPLGDGTGGVSIWGGEFEDEFHPNLRHDRPGVLSMANGGPNTNGSQFFVTTVPCPWLNDKHTVFGRLSKGMDVLKAIEGVRTDADDKPFEEIKVINVEIRS